MDAEAHGQPPDAELMSRIARRDEAAFAVLYDRHVSTVYGSVVRFLGDPAAAEETVQEAYLALWRRAELYDRRAGSVLGWLLGIARNKAIDRLRAAARRPRLVVDHDARDGDVADGVDRALATGGPLGTPDRDVDPAEVAARRWAQAVVRTALTAMSERERRVLELAYDDGLTQGEIADRLGWPLGTVKSRTRRALAALRESLDGVPDLRPSEPGTAPVVGTWRVEG